MNDQTGLNDLSASADEGRSKIFERALDTFDRARLPNSETGVNTSNKPSHGGYPTPLHLRDETLANPIPGSEWSADLADPDGINTVVSEAILAEEPVVGGRAWAQAVAAEIVASDSPRKNGFNYGSGWVGPMPPVYFDGVRLVTLLRARAHAASTTHWRMETALRNLRLAETETERGLTVITLEETIRNIQADDPTIAIDAMVEDIIRTVDAVAPFEPKGYVPQMNLAHAVHPIHKVVRRLRDYLTNIKG